MLCCGLSYTGMGLYLQFIPIEVFPEPDQDEQNILHAFLVSITNLMPVMVGIAAEGYNVRFNTKKILFCGAMLAYSLRLYECQNH